MPAVKNCSYRGDRDGGTSVLAFSIASVVQEYLAAQSIMYKLHQNEWIK